jgi:hypothetical protein
MNSFCEAIDSATFTNQYYLLKNEIPNIGLPILNTALTLGVMWVESGFCILQSTRGANCFYSPLVNKTIFASIGLAVELLMLALLACDRSCPRDEDNNMSQFFDRNPNYILTHLISAIVTSGVSIIAEPTEQYIGWKAAALGVGAGYGVAKLGAGAAYGVAKLRTFCSGFFSNPSEANVEPLQVPLIDVAVAPVVPVNAAV